MNILIVLMGSLGDVARGMALASVIKRELSEVKLYWLVEPACEPLVRCNSYVDEVIVFQRSAGIPGVLRLWSDLRKIRFDIALDLQRHFKSGFFTFLSGAKRRVGFHPADSKELNWLFNNLHIRRISNQRSKLEHYLEFANFLGLQPGAVDFGLARFEPRQFLAQPPFGSERADLAIVLGSRWSSKDWPLEHYQSLLEVVRKERPAWRVLLLGDSSKSEAASKLAQQFRTENLINLAGKTGLPQLMAVIKESRCCIGPDSGPAHLAAALGTPYVTLFGPTSEQRVGAYGMRHLALCSPIACAPCQRRICPGLGNLCMKLISAQAAYRKVCEAMGEPAVV